MADLVHIRDLPDAYTYLLQKLLPAFLLLSEEKDLQSLHLPHHQEQLHDAYLLTKGLLSEDDYLLQEILFNPRTPSQVENIRLELKNLLEIISNKDAEGMKKYLTKIREKIR